MDAGNREFLVTGGLERDPKAAKESGVVFHGLAGRVFGRSRFDGAAARPLWFDELLTLTIASQPNLHDM
jgi:hypothetical protein